MVPQVAELVTGDLLCSSGSDHLLKMATPLTDLKPVWAPGSPFWQHGKCTGVLSLRPRCPKRTPNIFLAKLPAEHLARGTRCTHCSHQSLDTSFLLSESPSISNSSGSRGPSSVSTSLTSRAPLLSHLHTALGGTAAHACLLCKGLPALLSTASPDTLPPGGGGAGHSRPKRLPSQLLLPVLSPPLPGNSMLCVSGCSFSALLQCHLLSAPQAATDSLTAL